MTLFEALFSFHGRTNRLSFLGYSCAGPFPLIIVMVLLAFALSIGAKAHNVTLELAALLLGLMTIVLLVWTSAALQVKRLHDLNFSGYFLIILQIVNLGVTEASRSAHGLITLRNAIEGFVFVLFFFLPGTRGANRYDA